MEMDSLIDKYVRSLYWLRGEFSEMDGLIDPVMGISDWDDCVCVEFKKGRLLVSVDGPYTKRLVLKSALVHAATDVAVKGGRMMFALDTLIGSEADVREMAASLKRQALALNIPILGGNTLFEETEARCSLTVVGELLLDEPIRDSTAKEGDLLYLLGEPVWGEQGERLSKAEKLLETWYELIGKVKVNAAKDVTKGGFESAVYEMSEKSDREFKTCGIPYSTTRNLDNFLVALDPSDAASLEGICDENNCPFVRAGEVL